jgi:hypothetical protein
LISELHLAEMIQDGTSKENPVLARLEKAINDHDLDLMVSCFSSDDYESTFPAHPDRHFRGVEQLKSNWSAIFGGVPNLRAKLLRQASNGNTSWAEWEWDGNRVDNARFSMRGVTIQGITGNRIAWARLYMEPVVGDNGTDGVIKRELIGSRLESNNLPQF